MSKNGGFFAKTPCAHMEKISARSGARAGEWQFREFVLLFVSSWRRNIRHCEDNGVLTRKMKYMPESYVIGQRQVNCSLANFSYLKVRRLFYS